jgi:hypothetical protein
MPMDCATATMEDSKNAISSRGKTSNAGSGLQAVEQQRGSTGRGTNAGA